MENEENNILEKWIQGTVFSDSQVLEILQDKGIISDNCYKLRQVGNCNEAVSYLVNELGM